MAHKDKKHHHESSHITLIDAVESLSNMADLEILPEVGITEKHNISVGQESIIYRSIQWVHEEDIEDRLKLLKEIFKVLLTYLRDFYNKQNVQIDTEQSVVENIKNIMVLVGEAAKKLDRFKKIFHLSLPQKDITDWKEYKQLQAFYLRRISHHIDESILSKWILGLAQKTFLIEAPSVPAKDDKEVVQTKHVFVDLEAVKKDSEYELFFIRKEDGSRFYNTRLIRNIKLVCDFGDSLGEKKSDSPLNDLIVWQDRFCHLCAKNLYKDVESTIKEFYELANKNNNRTILDSISKACMALMLSSKPSHLYRNSPSKCCLEYFYDFQLYLREIVNTREYQNLLAYPPQSSEKLDCCILNIIQALCTSFFKSMKGYQEMIVPIQNLLQEAKQDISVEHLNEVKSSHQIWNRLGCDNVALTKLIKRHSNGPLIKVLNILEESDTHTFDPVLQGNIPSQLYSLYFNETKVDCIHLPCPIFQERIDKVNILEEFKAYISHIKNRQTKEKHLIINLQDRTSWKEFIRCKILEEMQLREEFEGSLIVVTLPKDTDFYHQFSPYLENRHSDVFLKNLKKQILDESMGFFFPKDIKQQLLNFVDDLAAAIHRIFFHHKNILLPEARQDFIELFYAFLSLKIIELVQPSSFSFTCKDGIDIGSTTSALLFALLKLINEDKLSDEEIDYLNVLLYSSSLLVRERSIISERFKRLLNALKVFEFTRNEHGQINFLMIMREAFGRLYHTQILESLVIIPKEVI